MNATEKLTERELYILRGGEGAPYTVLRASPPDGAARGDQPEPAAEPRPASLTVVRGRGSGASRVRMIPCDCITPDPLSPRRAADDPGIAMLADSIHRHGVLVPLTVRAAPDGYALISGARRLRAARLLRMREVPCLVMPADDRLCAEFAVIESLQRRDLDIFEQARAIGDLIEALGLTREEAARQLSCSVSCVSNKLRLLRMTAPEREIVRRAGLSERHARAVLRLPDPDARLCALRAVRDRKLGVAAAEELVDAMLSDPDAAAAAPPAPAPAPAPAPSRSLGDLTLLENTLDRAVGALRRCGVNARLSRSDLPSEVAYTVTVPRG